MICVGLNASVLDDGPLDSHGRPTLRSVDGGSACISRDGALVAAIAEERLNRTKYSGGFALSLPYVLACAGVEMEEVDRFLVSFYGCPLEPPEALKDHVIRQLGGDPIINKITWAPSHHLAHACGAFAASGFTRSIIAVADNEGQIIGPRISRALFGNPCERNSYYLASDEGIALIGRDFAYPGGLGYGKLYNKITRYVGLGRYQHAGKTMGLAAWGTGRLRGAPSIWPVQRNGEQHCIVRDTGDWERDVQALLAAIGVTASPPRASSDDPLRQAHADLAEFVQDQLERAMGERLSALCTQYGIHDVCIAGGVALNSVMNATLLEAEGIDRVFVPGAPDDQGLSFGNVAFAALSDAKSRFDASWGDEYIYLGCEHPLDEETIRAAAAGRGMTVSALEHPGRRAAELLAAGQVIAWFQGRSEFGPRALGNRSILADPRDRLVPLRLNLEIKKREAFRPFAPSVLERCTREYFSAPGNVSPTMSMALPVRADRARQVPATTHVDGTARLQTVSPLRAPLFHELIEDFQARTGLPIVLNTSFNADGEPIVETPEDAIRSFERMPLDRLLIGHFEVDKSSRATARQGGQMATENPGSRTFARA